MSESGATDNSTGSLSNNAPVAIVAEASPPNVSARSVLGAMPAPVARRPMCALPILSGRVP